MKSKITAVLKFIVFLLLLPFVVISTRAFIRELNQLPSDLQESFILGILVYLLVHIFIYEPKPIYQYGQNGVTAIFQFFSPIVKVAPFVLPIFSIIFLLLFYFAMLIFDSAKLGQGLIFLVSFTLTMHMVFTAKILRDKDSNVIKPSYFFSMSLVYSFNIFILALLFDLVLTDFSFYQFFMSSTQKTGEIYSSVFRQLFVP